MRLLPIYLTLFVLSFFSSKSYTQSLHSFDLTTSTGEEVRVNVYPSIFTDDSKPIIIWFTEGYAARNSFKNVVGNLNDWGYTVWQIDLLESYFIERTPNNVRKLSGQGVKTVLKHAQSTNYAFVPVSTGRMSLPLLRGIRLWQLAEKPEDGLGTMQQTVLFFPNLYDPPQKAGDAPKLFPIAAASSVPLTIVQPVEGTYKWKLPELQAAFKAQNSQLTLVAVPKVRDWYFLRQDQAEYERQASQNIASHFQHWLTAGKVKASYSFTPATDIAQAKITERKKGLVKLDARSAPAFELTDTFSKSINLEEKKGKVVLLNFWASWCPPCVKEIPSMNRLAKAYDSEDFEIVSVNFKESPKTIKEFMQKVKVDFPVLVDEDGMVSLKYEIFSFPSSFIIDANGQMRYSVNAAVEWDEPHFKEVINSLID